MSWTHSAHFDNAHALVNLLRSHPVFSALMIIALVIINAEIWLVLTTQTQERGLAEEVPIRLAEIERLQRQKPAPNDENVRSVRDDFVQNAVVLSSMLRALNVAGPDELQYFQGEPTKSTDAYFDIAQFVERMQQLATDAGVSLRNDERFGFATYANVGPEPDFIRPVYRQRRIVEYLLRALFSARPRSLLSVQREVPRPVAVSGAPPDRQSPRPASDASAPPGNGDYFAIDSQVSARTPEYVDTMPFRITFAGQTAALRGFMNALAAPEIPLVMRSVEVEPVPAEPERPGGPGSRAGPPASLFGRTVATPAREALQGSVPIVSENDSRFTVTVELFEVKIRAPNLEQEAK